MSDPSHALRDRAYGLLMAAQDVGHRDARDRLVALEAEADAAGHPGLALLAASFTVFHDVLHDARSDAVLLACDDLVRRAEALGDDGLRGIAHALLAMCDAAVGDGERLVAHAGLAVSLMSEDVAPEERCMVWTMLTSVYSSLNLWELADDLNELAAALAPECERSERQLSATDCNRFVIRLAWAAGLLEHGDEVQALDLLRSAESAAEAALLNPGMPELWRLDALTVKDLLLFVLLSFGQRVDAEPDDLLARLAAHREVMADSADPEVLPYLAGFMALGLLRLGRVEEARRSMARGTDTSEATAGARAFHAWARAEVLAPAEPDESSRAQRDYGALVCDLRWTARAGLLAAARARIDELRLASEHARLSREVSRDPLTGLGNRRRFDQWLLEEPVAEHLATLLLIDIDDFKQVNDEHGHVVGDEVLRRIGAIIAESVREGDVGLRIGGDEFAVLMTSPLTADGHGHAERIRERAVAMAAAVAGTAWSEVAPGLEVSIAVGVAAGRMGPAETGAATTLYRLADEDLYAVKARRAAAAPRSGAAVPTASPELAGD
ncbi:MAG: GGDEF domain-containing protein [Nocardioides sp.]|uniref:GGDEF domain-containing protein n=1 Tax=Nocardioides sp. TaxID=35761 RepID=UPI0039E6B797